MFGSSMDPFLVRSVSFIVTFPGPPPACTTIPCSLLPPPHPVGTPPFPHSGPPHSGHTSSELSQTRLHHIQNRPSKNKDSTLIGTPPPLPSRPGGYTLGRDLTLPGSVVGNRRTFVLVVPNDHRIYTVHSLSSRNPH